jgi:hypothetical protein
VSDAGTWVAVWASNDDLSKGTSSDRDLLVARSTNGGQTWSDARFLNSDAATDQGASPIGNDGGVRVLSLGGTDWLASWNRIVANGAEEILYVLSTDDGSTWSDPMVLDSRDKFSKEEGKIVTDFVGLIIFWARQRPAPLKGNVPPTPLILGVSAGDISVGNPGTGPPVSGVDFDLRTYTGDLSGTKWTRPEIANPNAFGDSGDDREPVLATDGSGHVVLVWSSGDSLNNTIGFDADILVSTATANGLTELVTPNGGEKWKRGKTKKIEWVTNVAASENVRLNLLRNGSKVATIKNSTANDGKLKWKVPNGLSKGGGYQVEIVLKSDPSVNDKSYYEFKVK